MKQFILAGAMSIAMTSGAFADDVFGVWKTEVDDGAYAHISMAQCGSKICGVISRTFDSGGETKADSIGKKLVWDMVPNGSGKYSKGKIWQPSTDKIFKSKMALSGNSLNVSGCVGPICKKQTWTRVQ